MQTEIHRATDVCITDIQRFSLHDGPGIRTTVFFKGCPLNCSWCHNPETISPHPEWMAGADGVRRQVGRMCSVEEIFEEISKDRAYYAAGGGVTFSGGEPTAQPEALVQLAGFCRTVGIHVAVDTCCLMSREVLDQVSNCTDLFLCDLKLMDLSLHRRYTGKPNDVILQNIRRIAEGPVSFRLRIPLVHGVNDAPEQRSLFVAFIRSLGPSRPERIEILPYHPLGEDKGRAVGRASSLPDPEVPDKIQRQFFEELSATGAAVRINAWCNKEPL